MSPSAPVPMQFHLLDESLFRLDGGAMFGHVPKVVWSRLIKTDDENRIQLACKPLLVRHPSGRVILVETGMGTKWDARARALYALEVTPIEALLARHGLTCADVTDVILTHLHLDHAGGATTLDPSGRTVPAFPNAIHHVQRGEWDTAHHPDIRSKPSYRAENFDPIPESRWNLLKGDGEIMPGVTVRETPGHVRHHQSVLFQDGSRHVWFLGDIMPTSRHTRPHYVMGYDLYPLDVMATRERLLREAMEVGATLIFEHDADMPIGRLVPTEKGPEVVAAEV